VTRDWHRFTISEAAANYHEIGLMVCIHSLSPLMTVGPTKQDTDVPPSRHSRLATTDFPSR